MLTVHRVLLGVIVLGNAVAFAGVDPLSRCITAALCLILVLDLRNLPAVPRVHRACAVALGLLVVVQLVPLPGALRRLLQPGFADVMHSGWGSLSLAPWSTVQVATSVIVAAAVALGAARMATARSGLPVLLWILTGAAALLAVLGFVGEAGAPEKVLLVRANIGGGDVYGPFVNRNHFVQAVELSLPAAVVLLAAAGRRFSEGGSVRQRATVIFLAAAVTTAMGCAAVLRSGSRGGILFLAVAALISIPAWRRPADARRWPWIPLLLAVLLVAMVLASTQLPVVQERFSELLLVEGIEGNTRWDLWAGTARSWNRAPLIGSGLGSYRHVIGLDKPATGRSILEQAHNDWLEWLATGGLVGFGILLVAVAGLAVRLWPARVRRFRGEYRYPLAGAGLAVTATALHELVGFGLQTPLNWILLAVWVGMVWGITEGRGDVGPSGGSI